MRNCVIYILIYIDYYLKMEWFEELREDNDWAGIKSNFVPAEDEDDDDDDDF